MKFIIGTESKIKLEAARGVINQVLKSNSVNITGIEVESGVPATPWNQETLDGAKNRATNSKTIIPDADYWIGLESGLVDRFGFVFEEAWCCLLDKQGNA